MTSKPAESLLESANHNFHCQQRTNIKTCYALRQKYITHGLSHNSMAAPTAMTDDLCCLMLVGFTCSLLVGLLELTVCFVVLCRTACVSFGVLFLVSSLVVYRSWLMCPSRFIECGFCCLLVVHLCVSCWAVCFIVCWLVFVWHTCSATLERLRS